MVILAIDTSLASSGYCIGDDKGNIIKYGKVATNKKDFKDEETRMNHISNLFDNLIKKYNVNEIILEDPFVGKNAKGGMDLKKLQGYLGRTFKLYENIKNVSRTTPAAWRKRLLHSTKKVNKEDVFKWVEENIDGFGKVIEKGVNKSDDKAEAIGIYYAYLNDRENMIKNSKY